MTSNLAHSFVHILRESKSEIKERYKMQRHYGMLQNPIDRFKTLRSGLRPNTNVSLRSQSQGTFQDYAIPDELREKAERIRDYNSIKENIFESPPEISFISYTIPRVNSTSSSFRLCQILKILLESRCKINFLYCTELHNSSKYTKRFKGNINFIHFPLDLKEYIQFIADSKSQYVWVTELWRLNYVQFMTKLVGELKASCPSSRLIVDTVDFHYKEFYRKYELTKNPDDLERANEFLDNEKTLYTTADTVVVISEEERRDIEDKIAGIKKIEIVPNIHEIPVDTRPYDKRRNICFVGHFGNKHNVDAVIYFIENIFPLILERNPGVEFHVLGYSADRYKKRFASTNVKVIGGLKYLEEALTHYKLFVCPMIYGAGMKGKIGGAVAAGVPVVTTSIGAEGFPFQDGEECFIADTPSDFAKRCNQCLEDPLLWYNFSIKARQIMAENFSPGVAAQTLKKILSH